MKQATHYLTIKTGQALKTSIKANGMIGYRILASEDKSELFIRIESNEGGGYFSNELVPFSKIEECLIGLENNTSLPAKTFRPAFTGKSNNNGGFLCSILRSEGLMTHDPDKGYSHRVSCDWGKWKVEMLALSGEPFTFTPPEDKKTALKSKTKADSAPSTQAEEGSTKRKGKKNQEAEDAGHTPT